LNRGCAVGIILYIIIYILGVLTGGIMFLMFMSYMVTKEFRKANKPPTKDEWKVM
jgi:hypothetical protein